MTEIRKGTLHCNFSPPSSSSASHRSSFLAVHFAALPPQLAPPSHLRMTIQYFGFPLLRKNSSSALPYPSPPAKHQGPDINKGQFICLNEVFAPIPALRTLPISSAGSQTSRAYARDLGRMSSPTLPAPFRSSEHAKGRAIVRTSPDTLGLACGRSGNSYGSGSVGAECGAGSYGTGEARAKLSYRGPRAIDALPWRRSSFRPVAIVL
ncbi:hypothetical protein BU26DRAFT_499789 [Trematosphaeria pertusa]|uniref:Uncharacterized protein n=1 Tax=Trematosphaeria pertusa TaxID=390896 RepID=A0A6A6J340_9PLEO|nr:uncharacterized protein BU26DRAFT_499789 [Trematosphaeria pertusa]KAF2257264.1 hypothetical protein BU26DRAFT_499789 [Trematosphaeria pertusa]